MKRVFIAEDNELFAAAVTDLLHFHGYEFKVAEASNDILGQIKRYAPDIIILDIRMPNADGLHICRSIKSDPELQAVYVIILSCLDTEADIRAGRAAGADQYLVKPFSPQEVIKIMKSAK
jgi:DNA-binding response OmpR family regulator